MSLITEKNFKDLPLLQMFVQTLKDQDAQDLFGFCAKKKYFNLRSLSDNELDIHQMNLIAKFVEEKDLHRVFYTDHLKYSFESWCILNCNRDLSNELIFETYKIGIFSGDSEITIGKDLSIDGQEHVFPIICREIPIYYDKSKTIKIYHFETKDF